MSLYRPFATHLLTKQTIQTRKNTSGTSRFSLFLHRQPQACRHTCLFFSQPNVSSHIAPVISISILPGTHFLPMHISGIAPNTSVTPHLAMLSRCQQQTHKSFSFFVSNSEYRLALSLHTRKHPTCYPSARTEHATSKTKHVSHSASYHLLPLLITNSEVYSSLSLEPYVPTRGAAFTHKHLTCYPSA